MKTIIWDYNGTIIDDTDITVKIENIMIRNRNLDRFVSTAYYRSHFRTPMIDYYKQLGYTFEDETFEDMCEEFNVYYDQLFDRCKVMDGFEELITSFEEKGYMNVIISSCEHNKLNEQCKKLGIAHHFKEIIGIDNVYGGSKIENARHWMIRSGVKPEDCTYIGDTLADKETALAIGIIDIILVAKGHQSYDVLKKKWPIVLFDLKEVVV